MFGPATKDEAESYKNKLDKYQRKTKPPGDEDGLEPYVTRIKEGMKVPENSDYSKTVSLVNYKGEGKSLLVEGEKEFRTLGISLIQYVGLLALKNGGTISFDRDELEKVKRVRLAWTNDGHGISKVFVNEDPTPPKGMRIVEVITETSTNGPQKFWGYANRETTFPYHVYLDSNINSEQEIDVITGLLSKDDSKPDYIYSKNPKLDLLRSLENPSDWEVSELQRIEVECEPKKVGFWQRIFK